MCILYSRGKPSSYKVHAFFFRYDPCPDVNRCLGPLFHAALQDDEFTESSAIFNKNHSRFSQTLCSWLFLYCTIGMKFSNLPHQPNKWGLLMLTLHKMLEQLANMSHQRYSLARLLTFAQHDNIGTLSSAEEPDKPCLGTKNQVVMHSINHWSISPVAQLWCAVEVYFCLSVAVQTNWWITDATYISDMQVFDLGARTHCG